MDRAVKGWSKRIEIRRNKFYNVRDFDTKATDREWGRLELRGESYECLNDEGVYNKIPLSLYKPLIS